MSARTGSVKLHDDDVTAIPLRRPGRAVSAVLVVLVAGLLAWSFFTNPNLDWMVVGQYLFDSRVISGIGVTLVMTVLSMLISTVIAIVIAGMRLSGNPVLVSVAWVYVWGFRGTPMMVQIIFWGYLASLYPMIGIPGTPLYWDTNQLIPLFVAGLLALTLNQGAYSSEIVRAGMLSVDEGQREAAFSLGMSPLYTFRRVLLPQAMRVIIPPMGNELISMLKNTSLLFVIAIVELYTATSMISSQNFKRVELLIVASLWYLLMTSLLSIPQYYLERRFGRGASRNLPPTPLQRVRSFIQSRKPVPAPQPTEAIKVVEQ
ncbi:amino acid ABC transporter permease [Canibacter zhoujuaniae]|uniref:amino acid ABC transporter permease n=1 Tax=Canibacter zhoujuaniae TaxID=2708343 RepID=UPI001FBAED50|nr:amino acid ABC transporter permease [Canibacter zhoujuaniae]